MSKQEYEVQLIVTTEHRFTTIARTPEEAVSEAEAMREDGDSGEIINRSIEMADAYPIEDEVDFYDGMLDPDDAPEIFSDEE